MRRKDYPGYDTAQICPNGHVTNWFASSKAQKNQKCCEKCGEQTTTECAKCNVKIRGYYHRPRVHRLVPKSPPAYCYNCGNPYTWTEKRLAAAQEIAAELENLTGTEKESLRESLDDLVRDTPRTPAAVTRFKKLVAKAGSVAAECFKNLLVEIVSETVKKQIWP